MYTGASARLRRVSKPTDELKRAQKAEAFSRGFLQMWPFRGDATHSDQ